MQYMEKYYLSVDETRIWTINLIVAANTNDVFNDLVSFHIFFEGSTLFFCYKFLSTLLVWQMIVHVSYIEVQKDLRLQQIDQFDNCFVNSIWMVHQLTRTLCDDVFESVVFFPIS